MKKGEWGRGNLYLPQEDIRNVVLEKQGIWDNRGGVKKINPNLLESPGLLKSEIMRA